MSIQADWGGGYGRGEGDVREVLEMAADATAARTDSHLGFCSFGAPFSHWLKLPSEAAL